MFASFSLRLVKYRWLYNGGIFFLKKPKLNLLKSQRILTKVATYKEKQKLYQNPPPPYIKKTSTIIINSSNATIINWEGRPTLTSLNFTIEL